ncbi:hypothetical protein BVC80_1713g66 [Macleaya cordata]|uniref:Uncharacterized protein n=1 Tax=Macleaya cordata TaxID=56857 RepID=A0A200Q2F4_MACCD|nr:hypothetical protein BVC80_1713g66 [Macleaya cordata]
MFLRLWVLSWILYFYRFCKISGLSLPNLSEQSAIDAEYLIREIRPDAVIAQVASSALTEIQEEENNYSRNNGDNGQVNIVPTSSFGVIKGYFINMINKDKNECLAENEVLKEIFEIGFYGHFLAAKNVAKEVGSSFLLLYDNELANSSWTSFFGVFKGCFINKNEKHTYESLAGSEVLNIQALGSRSLVPQKMGSLALPSLKRLSLTNDLHSQMVKSIVSQSVSKLSYGSLSISEAGLGDSQLKCDYQAPSYAQTVYPLLNDLHDIFADLPSIGRAFAYAQKMLYKVDKGETMETQLLSEVHAFRVALEGM